MQDPQGVGSAPGNVDRTAPCYGVADLRIGAAIDVHGRTFFLHDCDDFTRGCYFQHRCHAVLFDPTPQEASLLDHMPSGLDAAADHDLSRP